MARVYRFTLEGTTPGGLQVFQVTQHYQTDVPVGDSEPSASTVLDEVLSHYSGTGHNLSFVANLMTTGTKLTRATMRSEIDPGSGDTPVLAEESLNISGTRTFTGDRLPDAMCVWTADRTDVAIRSARGGTHLPPTISTNPLTSDGIWDTSDTYWTQISQYNDKRAEKLTNVFGTGGTGDINPVVYSRTRRARGFTYAFEVTDCIASSKPRWLRRRDN